MVLLALTKNDGKNAKRIRDAIAAIVPGETLQVVWDFDSLESGLQQSRGELELVVLHASTIEELQRLISIKDLLLGLRVVTILPDSDTETVSLAHVLRPRYLCSRTSDFHDVENIVKHIIDGQTNTSAGEMVEDATAHT